MNIDRTTTNQLARASASAFTLAESLMAIAAGSVMLLSLYTSFLYGFRATRVVREDLRATQILVQRMEKIRMCSFNQIQDPTLNPPTSTEYYDPTDQSNGRGGVAYTVTLTNTVATKADLNPGYGGLVWYTNNVLKITATATWTNGNVQQVRSMQTFAARNGIQSYVVSPK